MHRSENPDRFPFYASVSEICALVKKIDIAVTGRTVNCRLLLPVCKQRASWRRKISNNQIWERFSLRNGKLNINCD